METKTLFNIVLSEGELDILNTAEVSHYEVHAGLRTVVERIMAQATRLGYIYRKEGKADVTTLLKM